ncbi:uncharacterized protein LOC129295374 [Prosopis cineraria]|uniref:uncharacterized protein LOC129295374 n=1 Tax=Prosopis cineraria TaxID=364024 RepID=UPI0024102621|nr:uncharacterized protein LOC129295374 [Prosopis cineraria]
MRKKMRKPRSIKNGQKEESSGSKRTCMEHLCTLPIIQRLLSKKKARGERDLKEKVDPETKTETRTVRHQNCRERKKMRERTSIMNGQKEESRGSKRTWREHIEQCFNCVCKWPIVQHLHTRATNGEEEEQEKEGSDNDQKMLIAEDDDINIEEAASSNSEKKEHMTDDERRATNIKEEGICYSKWSQVGDDILGLILERLCLSDYLRSRAVCSGWQSIVTKYIAKKQCLPQPELPLLYLQTMASQKLSVLCLAHSKCLPVQLYSATTRIHPLLLRHSTRLDDHD